MSLSNPFRPAAFLIIIAAIQGCNATGDGGSDQTLLPDQGSLAGALSVSGNRVIIQSGNLGAVASEVARAGGHVVRNMDFADALVANVPPQAIPGLQKRFPGIVITADILFQAIEPETVMAQARPGGTAPPPPQSTPWGITAIRATAANAINRGAGVKVCIVDTGIDKTHQDLAGNIVGGRNFVLAKGVVDPNAWNDDNGHGSHVSGTVAALDNSVGTIGVAPDAKLYGVKVLDRRGSGYLSDVADGVAQCVAAGAHVINMSLGANGDPNLASPLKTAVDAAAAAGVKVVVAAGNEGEDISGKIPAGYSSVIAVSAIDSSNQFPSFSNFGLGMKDFAAPGVAIFSTWKSGQYNTISGTSMASPHVAGVVALQLSSGAASLAATDIGATVSRQGAGRIDALDTVQ